MLVRLFLLSLCVLSVLPASANDTWPQWRGPEGTGVSKATGLPIIWNDTQNILWKCPLPAWGTSTPAIWKEAIFVTSQSDDKLLLLRIDAKKGEIVWQREVGRAKEPREAPKRSTQKFHNLHNLASPSPVTDGNNVVCHFGNGELACFDFDGKEIWKRNLQTDYGQYSIWWGHANSPVLYQGMVISVCMQDSLTDLQQKPAESYVVAHDLRDGHVKWKTPRTTDANAEQCDSYTTPLLISAGGPQLIVMGGNQLDSYDPASGKLKWFLPGLIGGRTVTGPTFGHDTIYTTRGMRGPMVAVPLADTAQRDGNMKRDRDDILWSASEGTPDSCSLVVWSEWLYAVSDDGIARCFEARTGHLQWKQRLKGNYKASPVACEGRIFFLNASGLCTVIPATNRFDRLAENQLSDETLASPAITDRRLYIRGKGNLYCIGVAGR